MFIYFEGLLTGAGLIIAIGAQNSYVLSQGIIRQYNWTVATICALCDATLIMTGAAGLGKIVATSESVQQVTGWAGALFLFYYGFRAFRSVFTGNGLRVEQLKQSNRIAVISTTLAITLFNPHVYLDTIVLLGSMSGQYEQNGRYVFALGAATASCVWFYSLTVGGMLLSKLFQHKYSWKILDSFVCITMWLIAIKLLPI